MSHLEKYIQKQGGDMVLQVRTYYSQGTIDSQKLQEACVCIFIFTYLILHRVWAFLGSSKNRFMLGQRGSEKLFDSSFLLYLAITLLDT